LGCADLGLHVELVVLWVRWLKRPRQTAHIARNPLSKDHS
jgi:hypothetical protein